MTKTPRGQNYEAELRRQHRRYRQHHTLLAIGQLQLVRTWTSLLERSLWHATKFDRAAASNGQLRVTRSSADLTALLADRAAGRPVVGGLLSIEGLQTMEGKFENIDHLHAAGFRMAELAHFFDNEIVDQCTASPTPPSAAARCAGWSSSA